MYALFYASCPFHSPDLLGNVCVFICIIIYNLNGRIRILLKGKITNKAAPNKFQELSSLSTAKMTHCRTYEQKHGQFPTWIL